jgi:hypothetical protein
MENDSPIKVEFYEPKSKDIETFSNLFIETMKENKFDGLILVCAHQDHDGLYLKKSIEYLGELYQI